MKGERSSEAYGVWHITWLLCRSTARPEWCRLLNSQDNQKLRGLVQLAYLIAGLSNLFVPKHVRILDGSATDAFVFASCWSMYANVRCMV